MLVAPLHCICLHKIYGFLQEGIWKFCTTNPFSELPSQDVNKLMEITTYYNDEFSPKFGDVILPLTSGRLIHLDLEHFDPKSEKHLISNVTQTRSSISMQAYATLPKEIFAFLLVRNIVSLNPYLEEFHSYIHPGFDVFRKRQNLRILKIYDPYLMDRPIRFRARDGLSVFKSLRNLEVLHIFDMDANTIADVLNKCPKLISIGLQDCLDSMKEAWRIKKRRQKKSSDICRHFQLQRCVWGKDSKINDRHERRGYHSEFCEKLRIALTLCPLVEELIFNVHVKNSIRELRFLKQLSLLRIDFHACEEEFVSDFVGLLQEIGPQLKHLSIFWKEPLFERNAGVPVDVICDHCPHLESLEMDRINFQPIFPREVFRNLSLKRLTLYGIYEPDESLFVLLSSCKHLEELFLFQAEFLDDALLSRVFQRNSFTKLRVVCIESRSVTEVGYQMFINRVASIQSLLILRDLQEYFYDVHRSFKDPNLHFLKAPYLHIINKEFFTSHLDEKRF